MRTGVKFIVAVILLFAFFIGGFYLGRRDIPQELFEDSYSDGYTDGLSDGQIAAQEAAYASGYADGHSEAESHSETYYELLRQAYQATGGAGAAFSRDDAGNVYVEETAPNGQKVKVPFTP